MMYKQYLYALSVATLLVLPACNKKVTTDLNNTQAIQGKNDQSAVRRAPRKLRPILKAAHDFYDAAQEKYSQEINLLNSTSVLTAQDVTESQLKSIKKIAFDKHEDYLKTWSNSVNTFFQTDITRNTPLYHYQVECDRDASKAQSLIKGLQKVSAQLAELQESELLEDIKSISYTLEILCDIIRTDLDFLRDKQACHADAQRRTQLFLTR